MTDSRSSAKTEKIHYETQPCSICNTEVALNSSVPEDTLETPGKAVIIGEGQMEVDTEKEGNWDWEVQFSMNEEDSNRPVVEGHIICDDCAKSVHGYDFSSEFEGSIPSELQNQRVNKNIIIYVIVIIILIIFILALL